MSSAVWWVDMGRKQSGISPLIPAPGLPELGDDQRPHREAGAENTIAQNRKDSTLSPAAPLLSQLFSSYWRVRFRSQ